MKIGPTWRVLIALVLGLLAGALSAGNGWSQGAATVASTIGGIWLDALKMTVIPLIVALLVVGIVGGAEAAREGGTAARSMLWFVVILTGSAVFGGLVMPLLLGAFPLPQTAAAALRAGLGAIDPKAAAGSVPVLADFVKGIIPANVVKAASDGAILPLVVFTLLFAFAIARIAPEKRIPLVAFLDAIAEAMLVIIGWVLWLAPVGVLALAFTVGVGAGGAAFGAVLHYMVLVSLLGITVMLAGYAVALFGARWSLPRFARAMIPPQAVAISTQSSLASLPAMLGAARELGVPAAGADVTLPLSVALFRATGPAMNMGVAIYVAHWLGVALTPWQIAVGVAVAAATTYSAVSLPGQLSFVTNIAPISLSMGLPIEPLAILIAVETIPDIFRTLGNVTMDVAVTGLAARGRGARAVGESAPVAAAISSSTP